MTRHPTPAESHALLNDLRDRFNANDYRTSPIVAADDEIPHQHFKVPTRSTHFASVYLVGSALMIRMQSRTHKSPKTLTPGTVFDPQSRQLRSTTAGGHMWNDLLEYFRFHDPAFPMDASVEPLKV